MSARRAAFPGERDARARDGGRGARRGARSQARGPRGGRASGRRLGRSPGLPRAAAHGPAGPRGAARGRAPGTRPGDALRSGGRSASGGDRGGAERVLRAKRAAAGGSGESRGAARRGARGEPGVGARAASGLRGHLGLRPGAPSPGWDPRGPGVPAPWGARRRAARAPRAASGAPSPPDGRGRAAHARTRLPRCPGGRVTTVAAGGHQDGCRGDPGAPTRAPRAPSSWPRAGQRRAARGLACGRGDLGRPGPARASRRGALRSCPSGHGSLTFPK